MLSSSSSSSASEKEQWELRKLQADVKAASRSRWIPWITAALAMGGFALQYQDAEMKRKLGAVELASAKFEREQTARDVRDMNVELTKARTDLEEVLKKRELAMKETDAALAELTALQNRRAAAQPATNPVAAAAYSRDFDVASKKLNASLQSQRELNTTAESRIKAIRPIDIEQIRRSSNEAVQRAK